MEFMRRAFSSAASFPERWDAFAVFLFALAARLLFCFAVYPTVEHWFESRDGYDEIAANLVHGAGYVLDGASAAAERLPLYPLFLVPSAYFFGAAEWPWQIAQAVLGAATCAVLFGIARRYAGRTGALAAAAACAIHPTLLLYTARPLTETLFILLLLVWFACSTSTRRRPVWGGTLLAAQLLAKSTAWLHWLAYGPRLVRGRGRGVFLAALVAALVVSPWVLWSLRETGGANLFTATSGRALYHGLYISRHASWTTPAGDLNRRAEIALWRDLARMAVPRHATVAQRDRVAGEIAADWIRSDPAGAFRLWARNLVLTWYLGRSRASMAVHALLHGVILLFGAAGALRLWRAGGAAREAAEAACLLIAAYTAMHAAVQPAVRYILPAVPLVLFLAAAVFDRRGTTDP